MDNKEFQKLLDKPSTKFILDHTMFAQLFFSLEHVCDESMPTAWCDGKRLGFNPDFFQSLTLDQQITVCAHELLHAALEHPWRRGARDPLIWNYACDHEVNLELKANRFVSLEGVGCVMWLCDTQFTGWNAEKIYEHLMKNPPPS